MVWIHSGSQRTFRNQVLKASSTSIRPPVNAVWCPVVLCVVEAPDAHGHVDEEGNAISKLKSEELRHPLDTGSTNCLVEVMQHDGPLFSLRLLVPQQVHRRDFSHGVALVLSLEVVPRLKAKQMQVQSATFGVGSENLCRSWGDVTFYEHHAFHHRVRFVVFVVGDMQCLLSLQS